MSIVDEVEEVVRVVRRVEGAEAGGGGGGGREGEWRAVVRAVAERVGVLVGSGANMEDHVKRGWS